MLVGCVERWCMCAYLHLSKGQSAVLGLVFESELPRGEEARL